jgi:DNA (cytosine-5)-methyltransferase 1
MAYHTLSAVSLFTGAGGLDLGFEAAGFETCVAVENDPDAVNTIASNRDWPIIADDIHSEAASSARLLERACLREGDADILIGGPPCQPFSKSGFWARGDARRLADPRSGTLGAYLRVLEDLKPKVFLLENVPGLTFDSKDEGIVFLEASIDAMNQRTGLNYSFEPGLLRATDFGVPQERHRVFIIGHREGTDFQFPDASHVVADASGQGSLISIGDLPRCPNAWDAIGEFEKDDDPVLEMTGKWADLLPSIPEGMNYLYHTDRGGGIPLFGWRRRYWSFLLKLAKRLPSWTIAAQPGPAIGPFHWKSRRLSSRELCALQTFPKGYTISGSQRAIQRQVGNAVPSALAERLALDIRSQLFGDSSAAGSTPTLIPKLRTDLPDPERVAPVPEKYLNLVGEHSAHPGTGKGYAALARMKTPEWRTK